MEKHAQSPRPGDSGFRIRPLPAVWVSSPSFLAPGAEMLVACDPGRMVLLGHVEGKGSASLGPWVTDSDKREEEANADVFFWHMCCRNSGIARVTKWTCRPLSASRCRYPRRLLPSEARSPSFVVGP